MTTHETETAKDQAAAQLYTIREMIEALEQLRDGEAESVELDGEQIEDEDAVLERMQENPLSLEFRGDWVTADRLGDQLEPVEFKVLLCTGGPAVQIWGELGARDSYHSIRLQYQDWGTPWTDYPLDSDELADVETYLDALGVAEIASQY